MEDSARSSDRTGGNSHSSSFLTECTNAALYAAAFEPARGIAQIVDHQVGTNLDGSVKAVAGCLGVEAPQAASFGTSAWYAQQLGGAAGMMVPFMLAHNSVKTGARAALGETKINQSLLDITTSGDLLGFASRNAALTGSAGFVYGSLLKPTDEKHVGQGSFYFDRIGNGASDLVAFGTLGLTAPYLGRISGALAAATETSSLPSVLKVPLSAVLSGPILPGIASGISGGAINTEVAAVRDGRPLASAQEFKENIVGMGIVGGAFGGAHWLGAQRPGTSTTNARHLTDQIRFTKANSPLEAEFRIIGDGKAQLSEFHSKLLADSDSAGVSLNVQPKLHGLMSGLFGNRFTTYGEARPMLMEHGTNVLNPERLSDTVGLIATCAPLDQTFRTRDVFPNRADGGSKTVWLSPVREGFILNRGEQPVIIDPNREQLRPVALGDDVTRLDDSPKLVPHLDSVQEQIKPLNRELVQQLPVPRVVEDLDTTRNTENTYGGKAYRIDDTENILFWQLPDGRIIRYANLDDGRGVVASWTPYGLNRPWSWLIEKRAGDSESQETLEATSNAPRPYILSKLDEAQGWIVDADEGILSQLRPQSPRPELDIPIKPVEAVNGVRARGLERYGQDGERIYSKAELAMFPPMLESDGAAARRIVPTDDGRGYVNERMQISNLQSSLTRVYRILSKSAVTELRKIDEQESPMPDAQAKRQLIYDTATKVIVQEDYAQKLDAVRELRRLATLDPDKHQELRDEILEATRTLYASDYNHRLLPEHMGQIIEQVPDPNLVREVKLFENESNPTSGMLHLATSYRKTGLIEWYGQGHSTRQPLLMSAMHEWSHLEEPLNHDLVRQLHILRHIEPFVPRDYSLENVHEWWAVNKGEMFLPPDPDLFITLASKAPIRTVALAEGLERVLALKSQQLADAPEEVKNAAASSNEQKLRARLAFVHDKVLPLAKLEFQNVLNNGDLEQLSSMHRLITEASKSPESQLLDRLGFDWTMYEQSVRTDLDKGLSESPFDLMRAARTLLKFEYLDWETNSPMILERLADYEALKEKLTNGFPAAIRGTDIDQKAQAFGLAVSSDYLDLPRKPDWMREIDSTFLANENKEINTAAGEATMRSSEPWRGAAAAWLMWYETPSKLLNAVSFIRDSFQQDKELVNDKFLYRLNDRIDADIEKFEDKTINGEESLKSATNAIIRSELLKALIQQTELSPRADMEHRLEAHNDLVAKTSQYLKSKLDGSDAEREEVDGVLDMLSQKPAFSGLARRLIDRKTFEHSLSSHDKSSAGQIAFARLYGVGATGITNQERLTLPETRNTLPTLL